MLLVEGTTSEPGGSRKPTTMKKITEEGNGSKAKAASVLDDLIQQGARQIIQQGRGGTGRHARTVQQREIDRRPACRGAQRLSALSGWVRVPVLRTRLSIFNANASAKRVPQVHEVGDDYAFAFLRRQFLRQQTLADAALDARDLRLDQRAHTVAIFLLK